MSCQTMLMFLLLSSYLICFVGAQLNFSPGWGKRAPKWPLGSHSNSGIDSRDLEVEDPCPNVSIPSLMRIYQLIKHLKMPALCRGISPSQGLSLSEAPQARRCLHKPPPCKPNIRTQDHLHRR